MRLSPRFFALLILFWGCLAGWLLTKAPASACPLGVCPACGACFRRPVLEQQVEGDRVA